MIIFLILSYTYLLFSRASQIGNTDNWTATWESEMKVTYEENRNSLSF